MSMHAAMCGRRQQEDRARVKDMEASKRYSEKKKKKQDANKSTVEYYYYFVCDM